MGELASHDDGPPIARCIRCGAVAAGPCARCHKPVCGDCSVLTEGTAKVWAICVFCAERSGKSLGRAWLRVVGWIVVPIVVLAAIVVVLAWLGPHTK